MESQKGKVERQAWFFAARSDPGTYEGSEEHCHWNRRDRVGRPTTGTGRFAAMPMRSKSMVEERRVGDEPRSLTSKRTQETKRCGPQPASWNPPDASMDRAHIFHPCRNPSRSVRPFPPSADRAPRIKRKHENRIETVFCDPFLVRFLFVGVAHADAHGRIARLVRAFHVLSKRF